MPNVIFIFYSTYTHESDIIDTFDRLTRNTLLLSSQINSDQNQIIKVQWIYLSVSDACHCSWEMLIIKTEMNVQMKSCLQCKQKQNKLDKYSFINSNNQCRDLTNITVVSVVGVR